MQELYLDESGDLGFSFHKGSSKYFVIGFIETSLNDDELNKIIKITKQRTIKKKGDRKLELKGSSSKCSFRTKKYLITQILKQDPNIKIKALVINKKNIYDNLREKKRVLYNWLCGQILNRCVDSEIYLIIDKKDIKNIFIREFNKYLESQNGNVLNIEHRYSHVVAGLQIVDIFMNSIFRYYERNETDLFLIFQDNVQLVKYYFN